MSLGLRLLKEQRDQISRLIFKDENEAAALALCGRSLTSDPWRGGGHECFVVRDIIEVPLSAYERRSPTEFTWSTTPFYNALKRSEPKDFAVAVFHSHPPNCPDFSARDDDADRETFQIAFDRLESRRPHLSVVMDRTGSIAARAYGPNLKPSMVDRIAVIGEDWSFYPKALTSSSPELDRQVRAFSAQSTAELANLRVGIVGCGGTGSAVASLLARIGIRHLLLIDGDYVDGTNLNRLHFSRRYDASLRRKKVDVVGEGVAEIGFPISIVRVPHYADHPDSLAALRACDVVFGCTDDHLGREILNRLAHFYFIPIIDLGLLIEPAKDGGYNVFDGRVTIVQPGYPCQRCRKLIDGEQMYLDSLRRDAQLYEARRQAGYVPDFADPSPAVVTFTTEVATMAVNELFHRLNGFRGSAERCSERVRQFNFLKDADLLPAGKSEPQCKLCGTRTYDGRGDLEPLLDLAL